jgi:hypothetical protein
MDGLHKHKDTLISEGKKSCEKKITTNVHATINLKTKFMLTYLATIEKLMAIYPKHEQVIVTTW